LGDVTTGEHELAIDLLPLLEGEKHAPLPPA
jgi:hypothetical protein